MSPFMPTFDDLLDVRAVTFQGGPRNGEEIRVGESTKRLEVNPDPMKVLENPFHSHLYKVEGKKAVYKGKQQVAQVIDESV